MGCLMPGTPLGPSIEGMGFLRAFAMGIRGTPCMTRGSFINVGSNFAGTVKWLVAVHQMQGRSNLLLVTTSW